MQRHVQTQASKQDRCTMSSDRALDQLDLEKDIAETWFWFQNANYWSKSNYIMGVMQLCESHLLSLIAAQANTLLASERKAFETLGESLQLILFLLVSQISFTVAFCRFNRNQIISPSRPPT